MAIIIEQQEQASAWDVFVADYPPESNKRRVGSIVVTNHGFFANPQGSAVQSIWCDTWLDAVYTCEKLGKATI